MALRKRKYSYAQREKMDIVTTENMLKIVPQPTSVVKMHIQQKTILVAPQQVHLTHGLGYSARPKNTGDGQFPIFSSYRAVGGMGDEKW